MVQLSSSNFDALFPFNVRINDTLKIEKIGSSIEKMLGDICGQQFELLFDFVRPKLSIQMNFESIKDHLDTVIIIEDKKSKNRFRGQFIFEANLNCIIYINSPWFLDVNDLEKNNLKISDFAIHDTITDNLQLLRSKQIVNEDMIKLNEELIKQRDKLLEKNTLIEQAENKFKLLVESSTDIIYRVNSSGIYIYVNPTVEKITGYIEEEIVGQHYTFLLDDFYKTKLSNFYSFQVTQNIESTYIEFPIKTKTNQLIWLGQSVNLVKGSGEDFEYIATARDITERKIAEKALMRSEEKYKSIIENLELGLLEVDTEGIIKKAYPKFCELVGYSEFEILGENGLDLFLDDEARAVMDAQNEQRSVGQSSVYELQLTKKSGEKVWVIISGAPYYDSNDEYVGSVGVHLDITDRKMIEDELKSAKEIAENSVSSKEIFLANMSHEIRTPLNAIIGMSELILQTEMSENQRKYLEAISSSSENLLVLINDILNFSKIDAGKIELEIIPINLKQILENSINLFEIKSDEKGIQLKLTLSNLSDTGYLCDPIRLGEILNNLLSNALKFTSKGEVELTCTIKELNSKKDALEFRVKDTGMGIEKDKLELIFDQFSQANEKINRKFGGTGLGLSISKELVKILGGNLNVESEINKGSCFFFTLELEKITLPKIKKAQNILEYDFLRNKNILVADDNELNLFLAKSILEKWECNVTCVENGAEAVDVISKTSFDLILMDIRMPILNGIGASWMIRNKLSISTPIIALTANIQKGDLEKYLENGMNDYLCKPFKQIELFEILTKYLLDNKTEIANFNIQIDQEDLVDLSKLKESFGNNEEFIEKMITLFINSTPESINLLEKSIISKDLDVIKSVAHKIKPSLDYLAIAKLSELAREIENDMIPKESFLNQVEIFKNFLISLISQLKK